jgi:formylglycine-generating enzyme required for sulfatase activity
MQPPVHFLIAVFLAAGMFGVCATRVRAALPIVIDTVTVGNPGNAGDPIEFQGVFGAVDYVYAIGKYEVTAGQYAAFLTAVAATDPYALYDTRMWTHAEGCKIERTGAPGSYTYAIAPDWANRPVNFVSWGDAARFANWLHNGQPTGEPNLTTTEDGSYFLDGRMADWELEDVSREPDATWVIPTENEWYKAAYHKNDGVTGNYWNYPTSNNAAVSNDLIDPDPGNNATFRAIEGDFTIGPPYFRTEIGAHENSASAYGAFDLGGNVQEFNETVPEPDIRGIRGGSWFWGDILGKWYRPVDMHSSDQYSDLGFRVAILPISAVSVHSVGATASLRFAISGTHPFRDEARFLVELPEASPVRIDFFDITGRRVAGSLHEALPAGASELRWKTAGLAPGVYLARLTAIGRTEIVRFVRIQ